MTKAVTLFSFLILGSWSFADIPQPVHLTCGGKGFALKAEALANVINSNRLTNIQYVLGSQKHSVPLEDGQLYQGHIWFYIYKLEGVEFWVEYDFTQKMRPLLASIHPTGASSSENVTCAISK